jgi:outer membrane protein TolC
VINAQLALLTAQTTQEQLTRNLLVASCTVLALIGRLEPQILASQPRFTAETASPLPSAWATTITHSDEKH